MELLGIQDICHFTSWDIGYSPFYFQGYGILCSISSVYFQGYSGKLIMRILVSFKGLLACLLQRIWDIIRFVLILASKKTDHPHFSFISFLF